MHTNTPTKLTRQESRQTKIINQVSNTHLSKTHYKNIIFDLGGVLLDFDPHDTIRELFPEEQVPPFDLLKAFSTEPGMNMLRGIISTDHAAKLLSEQFDQDKLLRLFTGIPTRLKPNQEALTVFKLIKQKNYKIYVLSNLDIVMHDAIRHYDFFNEIDGAIYSYQHKCAKPDAQIYELLLKTYNLKPEECLFIDDFEENIDGAKKCNINGILCTEQAHLFDQLKNLNIL